MVTTAQPTSPAGRRAGLLLTALAGLALAGPAAAPPAAADRAAWADRAAVARAPARLGTVIAAATVSDPVGDTFGEGTPQIDVVSFAAGVEGADLVLELEFDQPVSGADSGEDDALFGFIDLDTDQDGSTGREPFTDFASPYTTGMGNEYFVDLGSYDSAAGTVEVIDDLQSTVAGLAEAVLAGSTLEVRVPLTVISDDGLVHTAAVVGTVAEPTDAVPNGGLVTSGEGPGGGAVLLNGDRFAVEIAWRDFRDREGVGQLAVRSDDSANFWFFRPDNWELLIKVLDGCPVNDRFWVFVAAVTNVEYTVTVHDTDEQVTRVYRNELGERPQTVLDTEAFDTCP